jgi:alanine racemase
VTFGARARISLDAVKHNLETIRATAPDARIMAVVKANAYGHGLGPVCRALGDVDCVAVARLAEVRSLRTAGFDVPVVLLGGVLSAEDIDEMLALGVRPGIHNEQQIAWLEERSSRLPFAWLKIDTGMHRLGMHPDEAAGAMTRLRKCCDEFGLMTHFASADDEDDPMTLRQIETFLELIEDFDGHVSIANSAGVMGWAEQLRSLDGFRASGRLWIRPGLSLYGISPFPGRTGADMGLRPAMRLEATLMSVKRIRAGSRVGYGGTWVADRDTTLGIIAAGYGDGYSRYIPSGTPVLVNGCRASVAGRVSMDLTAVDLGPDAAHDVGDPVILWGDELPVEQVARCANTIPYQLVTGVTHREAPVYEE